MVIAAWLATAGTALVAEPVSCGGCWRPRPTTSPWQIQLQGKPNLGPRARVYELDGEGTARSIVRRLHRRGARVICYFNAGAWEDFRDDKAEFPARLLGKVYSGYPDERWLDIRRIDLLAPIIAARLKRCREKGFDAADGDNVDGYQQDTGFALSSGDQLRYDRWLAGEIHRHRMAAMLKNDGSQVHALARWFEGAVVEECFELGECNLYRPFARARKPVYAIEYRRPSRRVCRGARGRRFSVIFMRPSLAGTRRTCRAVGTTSVASEAPSWQR